MKIMCLNGWGGRRYDLLLPYVAAQAPDILCLQEVVHSPTTTLTELTYRDGDHVLPQRANFFRDVCAMLPGYVATFCPAAQGVLWNGDQAVPSQWGLATFVHPRLSVIGQVQGFVHKDFSADGYGVHPRSRSAHGVRVWDFVGNRAVAVTHMHGLRDLAGKHDTQDRTLQTARLLDLAQTVAGPGDIEVICGDFNVLPRGETLKMCERAGFTELVTHFGFQTTRTSLYRKPERFADYMLVKDVGVVRSFDVVADPEISDHCPLVLRL